MGDIPEELRVLLVNDWRTTVLNIAQNDPNVVKADLKFKNIDATGASTIALALGTNTNLKELNLISNKIGDQGAKALANALRKNTTLQHLDISFNEITDEGASEIAKAMEKNHSLTTLFIIGNDAIQAATSKKIFQAIQRNKNQVNRATSTTGNKAASEEYDRQTIPLEMRRSVSSSSQVNSSSNTHNTNSANNNTESESNARIRELEAEVADLKRKLDTNTDVKRIDKFRKQISSLNSRNKDLRAEVKELKQKLNENKNKGPPTRSISSSTREPKTLSINLRNLIVNEKIAETGGSAAGVFSCMVDGWTCAMKELSLSEMDKDITEAFENEISLLEKIEYHPNICRYLFHDSVNNKLRLFMTKYANSLGGIIRYKRKNLECGGLRFDPTNIARYCLDMIKGLDFLHKKNIIHRDLKSDNIFVTLNERKEINTLAIGDFDTAKAVVKTMARTIIGTPGYMAPEVLRIEEGGGAYTYKADVYSFGIIVYELITLKRPYEDTPYYLVDTLVLKGQRPPIDKDLYEYYGPLINLFNDCTELNPDDRPTVGRIKEELINLL
eukprot:CAMPEP_0174262226 /NCGR_PEP_ID=MMETSP0439-20130205/12851_1 /TAXON_ID=0 /ORGANISM="Stereomyxa ramosa, Strain Chinc5" /LENGTH=556 /DNA_ID=CAMNT_0015346901 /DNA_START=15 /DNA_END=1685 /DNA_ORIENTATION=-